MSRTLRPSQPALGRSSGAPPRRGWLSPALALPLVFAAVGCVDKSQSLMIVNFMAITPDQMCKVATNQTEGWNQGTYDVGLAQALDIKRGYVAAPMMQNNLVPTGSATAIERAFITVNAFEVELKKQTGELIMPAYTVVAAVGTIDPGGGRAVAVVELIPAPLLEAAFGLEGPGFNGVVIAHTRAIGMQGGIPIQSAWFQFPVEVCYGCLAGNPRAPCPTGGYEPSTVLKGGCLPTQDFPVTCCSSNGIICGDGVPLKASSNAGTDAGA